MPIIRKSSDRPPPPSPAQIAQERLRRARGESLPKPNWRKQRLGVFCEGCTHSE